MAGRILWLLGLKAVELGLKVGIYSIQQGSLQQLKKKKGKIYKFCLRYMKILDLVTFDFRRSWLVAK